MKSFRLAVPMLAALAAAAAPARAESPLVGSFQLQMSSYRPNIDAEFKGKLGCGGADCSPFADIYGTGHSWMFEAQLAASLYVGRAGTVDLGVGAGYYAKTGKGLIQGTNTPSGDDTSFRIIPLSLSLTYRFDIFATTFPLVPYARASLLRYQWWVTNGSGSTASAPSGSGSGATHGYGLAGGVAFLLDFLDPQLAREMDRDVGINHTYLFVEGARNKVDAFGSSKSWDLSNDKSLTWSGGILFVF